MKIKEIKKKIYRNLALLIFWRKHMFFVKRVRVKASQEVIVVPDGESVDIPDWEMWAVFKTGENKPRSLHFIKEDAMAISSTLTDDLRNKIKTPKPK